MNEDHDIAVHQISITTAAGEQALRLRRQYWVDEFGWKAPDGTEFETDDFDSVAYHFGAFDGQKLTGYCRFIPNTGTLPIAAVFPSVQPLLDELGPSCGEYSRLVIEPSYRGGDLSLFFYRAVFQSVPEQVRWWFFEVEDWMISIFRQLHFEVRVLGAAAWYRGVNGHPDQATYPVVLDVHASLATIRRDSPAMIDFLASVRG